ncbi:hypothetical protein B0I75DRAFT_129968 [Yarrowia lipolytica]|nr:hypothetical protein B0I74DRAFT_129855 [Yarrowia lipolytica]RDW51197.1 hypothetical protein B0I75DRAFT_129968 [Yarrowia lipolytica]
MALALPALSVCALAFGAYCICGLTGSCSGERLLLPFRTHWLWCSLSFGVWHLLPCRTYWLFARNGNGSGSIAVALALALIALRTYWLCGYALRRLWLRFDSGISALVTNVTALALVWLWLALIAPVGLIGSDSGICCSFDHIWRLSKQIFALVMRLSSASQLAPQRLAALAFQLGSSVLGGSLTDGVYQKEFHP